MTRVRGGKLVLYSHTDTPEEPTLPLFTARYPRSGRLGINLMRLASFCTGRDDVTWSALKKDLTFMVM